MPRPPSSPEKWADIVLGQMKSTFPWRWRGLGPHRGVQSSWCLVNDGRRWLVPAHAAELAADAASGPGSAAKERPPFR